ncbi:MAG: phospholipid carrier-dependent glycosyltransferase, partial [Deltaproteobacteria bacterium]|nr:phospholipid carrier-dependent glycosyltransferase [Deltaproteobacteria bacterium]
MQDSVSSVSKPVCLFLVLCFLTAYVLPLSQRLFFEPDETRYAEISREMADGGGWLKLRLLGLPYYEKPPLGYWLGAASMSLFGREPWAARLPAALAASGAALAVFMLLRACARGRSEDGTAQGLTAAVIYLSFFEVFGVGTFITLDSLFTFFITLCMAAFFTATQTPPGRAKTARLTLAGLACACAFLTKGFIALVIPMLTLGLWLPWQGLLKRYMGACLQA